MIEITEITVVEEDRTDELIQEIVEVLKKYL